MERVVIKKEVSKGVKTFFMLLGLAVFLVSVGTAYVVGSHFSIDGAQKTVGRNQFLAEENARLSERVKTQLAQLAGLQQDLIAAKSEIELKKLTADGLKKAVDEETRRRLLLEKELSFYRKVSRKKSPGFLLPKLSFRKDPKTGGYIYRFTIRKAKKDGIRSTGRVELSLMGKRGGKKETIRIPALSDKPLVYGFKYFQAFEGGVSPGDDFTPEKLKVVMVDKESGKSVMKKTYSWADVFAR